MYARVAKFEGHTAEEIDGMITSIKGETGPPEGVPAVGFLMLINREKGTSMGISFFQSEDDLRKGDEALNAMSGPPTDSGTRRTEVETYEVGVDLKV